MGLFRRIRNDYLFLTTGLRTLRRAAAVNKDKTHTYADTIEQLAAKKGDNIALIYEDRKINYRDFNAAANRYANWLLSQGVKKGDVVALLMENRPEYIIAWLGIVKVGATAALINSNLIGAPLAHSLNISNADHLVLGAELTDSYGAVTEQLERPMATWVTGGQAQGLNDLDAALAAQPDVLPKDVRKGLTSADNALYIYTSGTTGNPKAARISHARMLTMMVSWASNVNATEKDCMYSVLPLYHSAGGVCAVGTVLTVGGSLVIRRRFSASEFWDDAHKYKPTLFQYIGELLRYLNNTPPHPLERHHNFRIFAGNGLRPEVWKPFQERFKIPRIMEFYGATEGNIAMMNYDGTVGAIGRIPPWAEKRLPVVLVKFDVENEVPVRGPDGFCIKCDFGEPGEALGEIQDDETQTLRFEGYAKKEETEKKILHDVFRKGDKYFRSGDLLRKDKLGYFYFVDRIGDTFRWKGENVATSEVAEVISTFPGASEANVYGVAVPGTDGRAGMVSLVTGPDFDFARFRAHLEKNLPDYARPLFVRVQPEMEITGTFKHRKVELVKEGFNPDEIAEPLYFNSAAEGKFVPLDQALYSQICGGQLKL
ncbi:MAG: long-chain-acyl-CoA synthetase [Rhizobiales bacterium]|nr:long-chain-acyl-CoA synthetase [Hyphomicrobiales bacterium]